MNIRELREGLRGLARGARTRGVYALVDPRDGRVRYIGMSDHIEQRYMQHVGYPDKGLEWKNRHKRNWVFELLALGLTPQLQVLQAVAQGDMREIERDLIVAYDLIGEADLNWCETIRAGKSTKWRKAAMDETSGCSQ